MEPLNLSYPASDLELARRLERTEGQTSAEYVRAKARYCPESGAECIEVAGTLAMFDGVQSPLTQTFGLGIQRPVAAAELQQLEEFFSSRGAPTFHEVSPLAGVELYAALVERGYKPIECSSVMYRPVSGGGVMHGGSMQSGLKASSTSASQPLEVRPIDEEEHAVWAKTAAEGWREAGDFSALMTEAVKIFSKTGCWTPFIVELGTSPIAAGGLSIVDGVCLLAGASTIPEARKQGAQLALLEKRLEFAAERGCQLAMMCAAPGSASQRNAQRNGFRIAYTRVKWQKEPAKEA